MNGVSVRSFSLNGAPTPNGFTNRAVGLPWSRKAFRKSSFEPTMRMLSFDTDGLLQRLL